MAPEIQAMIVGRGKPLVEASPLFVWRDHFSLSGKLFPLRGARAEVVMTGETGQRVSATRVAALGVFALAAKKKTDSRQGALVINGYLFSGAPHSGLTFRFPNDQEVKMRKVASLINQLAGQIESPPVMPSAGAGLDVDKLNQLAALHSTGTLTDDEFAAAKARLLS